MHEKEARSILSAQNGMNLYKGCTQGCLYCDARSTTYKIEHAFDDVEVRSNAAELLEVTLKRKRGKCMISTGAMADPYQEAERSLGLMRSCLEIIDRFGFGLTVLTRSDLILRDLPLLESIHRKSRCVVRIPVAAADDALSLLIEPGSSPTGRRFEVLERFRDAGIPTVAILEPILPGINDSLENMEYLMERCIEAQVYGVEFSGASVNVRPGCREHLLEKLGEHFPEQAEQYAGILKTGRELKSEHYDELRDFVHRTCADYHIEDDAEEIFTYLHAFVDREAGEQLSLFDLI